MPPSEKHIASFRDPAGYIFVEDGVYKRAITERGRADHDLLMESGVYDLLVAKRQLLPHHEQDAAGAVPRPDLSKVLVPEQLAFVSYPYEWCFEQLKDAALLTLDLQREALQSGLSLKDASFFNVQFHQGRPVFIDISSFEKDTERPWVAYRQFCEHFLAPLLLAASVDLDLQRHLIASLDGLDLGLANRLLPLPTRLRLGVFLHLGLHARSQEKHRGTESRTVARNVSMSTSRKLALVDSLASTVRRTRLGDSKSSWSTYYAEAGHYSDESEAFKKQAVQRAVEDSRPKLVFDLGGNVGNYSRIVTALGIDCVCYDQDPLSVNLNYVRSRDGGDSHMLPLVMDLTNPTPSLGFAGDERMGFLDRPSPDLVLALAVVHHLRITGNIPLSRLADFLARLSRRVVIEFIPKEDPLAQGLLAGREDTFHDYYEASFKSCFHTHFQTAWRSPIPGTARTMYLFERG